MKRIWLRPPLTLLLALLGDPVVREDFEGGAPLLELHLPVEHHTRGHDYQVRAPHPLVAGHVRQEGDGLDGLP
uniref:Putative secreted protein n=1 Tax=Ixodes ricinus TaxID=34613 RepID=A0A6B0U2J9_IXORI